VVLIGDQCLEYEKSFRQKIDLASEWKDFTGLPFVFACWTANKVLPQDFTDEFNRALNLGISNFDKVVESFAETGTIRGDILKKYLTENIDYQLDEEKKKGLELFLDLIKKL
jgi:chorismate dehydratase